MKKLLSVMLAVIIAASVIVCAPVLSQAAGHSQTEKEGNDSYNDANLITLGNTLNGEMNDSTDFDYYKFISNEDGKINITFVNNTQTSGKYHGSWTLFLSSADVTGRISYFSMIEMDLSEKSVTFPFIGAKAGTYYFLQIYPGPRYTDSHAYTIKTSFTKSKFYEKENNESEATATKYILANKYTGTIGSDFHDGDWNEVMDADYYRIKAPAKGTMTLKFNHKKKAPKIYNDGGWYVNLYKHHNGGNLSVANGIMRLNGDASTKLIKTTMAKNAEYWFTVQSAYDSNLTGGGLSYASDVVGEPYNITSTFVLAAKPKLTTKTTKSAVTLSCKKLSDVTGYEVQIKSGKTYKKLTTTKKPALSYKKSGLKKNTKYTFRVRAYLKKDGTTYYGNWVTISAKTKKK